MRTKPKWGVQPNYWIPEVFKLSSDLRREIAEALGKRLPERFYRALESATDDFIAWRKYRKDEATFANVEAALADIDCKTRGLAGRLSEQSGLDGRTRQYIQQYWELCGMTGDVIENCSTALWNLCEAVETTRNKLKHKIHRGPRGDPKVEFVGDIATVFRRFKFRPQGKAFESCISALLAEVHENTSQQNIYRLATSASHKLPPKRGN